MSDFEKNITFVIVSFKSSNIIEKCIQSINSSIKIIIVENSNNIFVKKHLENKFSNVEVIIAKENFGYGKGNNYGYFSNQKKNSLNEILEVDYVKGFAMLINLKSINFDRIFDENFFLFLEEIDLCKRIKVSGGKIFVALNSKIQHSGKQATKYSLNIELCRNWHWMWSLFYYNNKHFGTWVAYNISIHKFFSSIFKLFLALVFFNKKNFLIHYYRLSGLFNAFLKKPAWLRPDNT